MADHEITKHNLNGHIGIGERRFRGLFGTTANICSIIWQSLSANNLHPNCTKPLYLLCALLFLKLYATEESNKSMTGLDENNIKKMVMDIY